MRLVLPSRSKQAVARDGPMRRHSLSSHSYTAGVSKIDLPNVKILFLAAIVSLLHVILYYY